MIERPASTPAGQRYRRSRLRRMVPAAMAPQVKPSAIMRSTTIERWQPTFERFIGGALLGLSIAGTVALFNGSWGQPALPPFLWGIFVQFLLTLTEWMYRRRRRTWQYSTALLLDTGLSVGGYAALGYAPLVNVLALAMPVAGARIGAGIVLLAAATFLAYIPERILVTD